MKRGTKMSKKILVVDDEKSIVDILKLNLQKEGYAVTEAYDGLEAVEKALPAEQSERPDLILLDVMLPEMSGFDVCKKVRESSAVPILMLTAREDEVDKVLGLEIGADDYITKPFSMRELIKFLSSQPNKIFSRKSLLEYVWDYEYYGDVRTVDVTIRRLREKIEDDPSQPRYIMTKRGVGYYFSI